MKDLFKTIIKDFHTNSIPAVKKRNLSIPINSNKIVTIIGGRRTGKTYYLYQLINQILDYTEITNIVYINFEDERLNISDKELQLIIDAYYELYPDNKSELYFFFDEIQYFKNWERFVRRIYDSISKKIFITGSSSKLLSKEIATSLRGRSITYELFPLTFNEYLQFRNIDSSDIYSTRNKAKIRRAFNEYLFNGGYPEVVNFDKELRLRTLQSYFDVMIYRDIIERYEIRNVLALKYFIKKSISNVANYLSINKLYNELKSAGIKISKDSIYDFINYVNDCYLLFLINIYSESIHIQNTNDKKIYCVDNGIVSSISYAASENIGRLLENIIYLSLRVDGYYIYYFRDKRECDFVVIKEGKIKDAIQVTKELNSNNREREIEGLINALEYFGLKKGTIITLNQSDELVVNGKHIKIVPAWQWLLKKNNE